MFKKFLAALTASVLVLMPVAALAQGSGGAVSFEIMAPTTATAGEAIDVTVRALDKEKKTATEYRGSVTFLTDWIGDTVPMPGRSIAFSAEDQGEKKFSKGVIFKKPGKNKLIVSDVDGDVRGEVTITVVEGAGGGTNSEGEISIITPENNGKITSNTLSVSGKTRKNSKVTLKLNGTDVGSVISDDAGLFTKEIQGISQENNILSASLIDANNAVIGKPAEVNFTRVNESGSIYGLTIAPSTKVEVSSEITLTIEAVKGLAEVSAVLDGTSMTAKEVSDGKYTIKTTAPAKEGEYPITVNAKTVTGQSTVKENMAALMVSPKAVDAPLSAFKNIKAVTQDSRVTFSFEIENTPADLDAFKITYGATGSIMTHQANSIVKNGVYTWYVDQLPPQDYTFKIHGQKADGLTIEWLISEPIMATIGVSACTISNVGKITVKTDTSKSVLSWEPVADAIAYNVYKVAVDGDYHLVEQVKTPSYTVFLSRGAVTHDDFAVKAVCGDGNASQDYSHAAKVQTGPGMIAFIVIASGILAAFILRRRAL